jgi:hypothetical protein
MQTGNSFTTSQKNEEGGRNKKRRCVGVCPCLETLAPSPASPCPTLSSSLLMSVALQRSTIKDATSFYSPPFIATHTHTYTLTHKKDVCACVTTKQRWSYYSYQFSPFSFVSPHRR